MILLYLIILGLIYFVMSELTMILVYGVPSSLVGAQLNYTLSWKQCIQSCYNSQSCIMAWQVETTCATYFYNFTGTITPTDYKNGSIVAFKVETVDGECPNGTNPPTFDDQNATGSLYITTGTFPKWIYFTISLTDNTWIISYTVNNSCSSRFADVYNRSDGSLICVSGYIDTANDGAYYGYDYNNAITFCNDTAITAKPAAFLYSEDVNYFIKWAQQSRSSLNTVANINDTYIRIDGMRTAECQQTPTTAECMSVEGFTFTGPQPENFDYYDWVTNSSSQTTTFDNCIVMVMNGSDAIKMDIRTCLSDGSPLPPKMIFCSSPAWNF